MYNHYFNTVVSSEKDGARLDQILDELLPDYSRAYLQKKIAEGSVTIDNQITYKKSTRVYLKQSVALTLTEEVKQQDWVGEKMPLDIVYEDEALCVVNKPFGIVTHPAPGHLNHTLANGLLNHLPALQHLPRAGIIHRLDKDTSGLLVVPKTLLAHTLLVRQIATREMKRFYHAIVKGSVRTSGFIDLPIGRHPIQRQKQAVVMHGKPALTYYTVSERFRQYTFLSIQLKTGRTHQIRVHMAHLKHAILGDQTYGRINANDKVLCQRQALHASRLELQHPLTEKSMTFSASLPWDIQYILDRLRTPDYNSSTID